MPKKKSNTLAIDAVLNNAIFSKWCIVNTDNEFSFIKDCKYVIDSSVKQYSVLNKMSIKNGKRNDWTNQSLMTRILVVDVVSEIRFFDENLLEISHDKIKIQA